MTRFKSKIYVSAKWVLPAKPEPSSSSQSDIGWRVSSTVSLLWSLLSFLYRMLSGCRDHVLCSEVFFYRWVSQIKTSMFSDTKGQLNTSEKGGGSQFSYIFVTSKLRHLLSDLKKKKYLKGYFQIGPIDYQNTRCTSLFWQMLSPTGNRRSIFRSW